VDLIYAALDGVSDLLVMVTVILTGLFVLLYSVLFDPRLTTAGRIIRRTMFALLLLGVVALVRVVVTDLPDWWPMVRIVVWVYLVYSFASLATLVVMRRFWPQKVKTRPDEDTIEPRPRHNRH
jgi:hypothetical protein